MIGRATCLWSEILLEDGSAHHTNLLRGSVGRRKAFTSLVQHAVAIGCRTHTGLLASASLCCLGGLKNLPEASSVNIAELLSALSEGTSLVARANRISSLWRRHPLADLALNFYVSCDWRIGTWEPHRLNSNQSFGCHHAEVYCQHVNSSIVCLLSSP